MRKIDFNVVKQEVEELGYELISEEYINYIHKLILMDINGYYYTITLADLLKKHTPHFVHTSNPYTINNIKTFLKNNNSDLTLLSEIYEGDEVNLKLCDSQGYYYSSPWCNIKRLKRNIFVSKVNVYSSQNIQLFLDKNNIELKLISNFEDNHSKLTFIDNNNGYLYFQSWNSMQLLKFPRLVHKSNPYSIQNIILWCKLNNKPFKLLSDTYETNYKNLKWKCLNKECGEIFNATWTCISVGSGCGYCSTPIKHIGLSNCLATKNPKLALEWHPIKNGDLTPYDVSCGTTKEVWWKCKECGHEWKMKIAKRNGRGDGCPECNKSKGEKRCKEVFISKSFIEISQEDYKKLSDIDKDKYIYFIPQIKYDNLIGLGNGLLSYDFYIPKYNFLIEYDGEFHYKAIRKYKNEPMKDAEERFKKQQIHDQLKNEYCKKHNIKLLRIPYWDFDNIESILSKELDIQSNKSNISNQLQKVS